MNIKAIIFDLDGVLVNTKDLHFKALNNSISIFDKNYIISYEDHLSIYDGLSTKEKLDKLVKLGLNNELAEKIHIQKQIITKKMIESEIIFNSDIFNLFSKLYDDGYKLTIATNSIRDTLNIIIDNLKIGDFLSLSMSNEDVILPKPHSEIYLKTFFSASSAQTFKPFIFLK